MTGTVHGPGGAGPPRVRIEAWAPDGLALLRRANTPEMTAHLGGPESAEQLTARHRRYLRSGGPGRMFRIVAVEDGGPAAGAAAGVIGFWQLNRRGGAAYEAGWSVLPEFQGRGIAVAAARSLVERARAERTFRFLHAFPSVHHGASNAVCRRAGFALQGECDVEYPKGRWMRSNDWRLDLAAGG